MKDGKPLIIEGCHLDPGQLLAELSQLGMVLLPAEPEASEPSEANSPSGMAAPAPAPAAAPGLAAGGAEVGAVAEEAVEAVDAAVAVAGGGSGAPQSSDAAAYSGGRWGSQAGRVGRDCFVRCILPYNKRCKQCNLKELWDEVWQGLHHEHNTSLQCYYRH